MELIEENKKDEINKFEPVFQIKHQILHLSLVIILWILGFIFSSYFDNKQLSFIFYFISYVIGSYTLIINAIKNLLIGKVLDENFLMSIATIGAFILKDYNEAIAVIVFYKIGILFEEYSTYKTRNSIKSLMKLRPDYINLLIDNEFVKTNPEVAKIGDIIQIKPGEKIALDSKVIEGESLVDNFALTGESKPVQVKPESNILSGAINLNGVLNAKVEKTFYESTLSKILKLIENAIDKKAKVEKFITKFSSYYTPLVVILAILICVIPYIFLNIEFSLLVKRALIFLVISCPCALVLSIPISFFAGIHSASKNGILIKGSAFLETLSNVNMVIFDKTGTLTYGNFNVVDIICNDDVTKEELLYYAALAEIHSNHPIAYAIKNAYFKLTGKNILDEKLKISSYEEIHGTGIKACINNKKLFVGHDRYLHEKNIFHLTCLGEVTTVHVVVDDKHLGYLLIADEIKEDASSVINWLNKNNIKTVMLTGDVENIAYNIAKKIGINEYYSQLLPDQKVEKVKFLKQNNHNAIIAFVGDGLNDAPVIAQSDVGIAMGGLGIDATLEAADVVIMNDSLSKVINAIKIANETKRIVYQNIILSLGIKLLFLVMAAFGITTMWEAVFADVGVSILAILNAMRLIFKHNL